MDQGQPGLVGQYGQGIGGVKSVESAGELVARLKREYDAALGKLTTKQKARLAA